MRTLTLGVYVIGVTDGRRCNAYTACSVMPASLDPVMLAVCVGNAHASHPLLQRQRAFTVNVLRDDQLELARHFGTHSARELDKLGAVRWRPAQGGAPILPEALAYFECTPEGRLPAGDHELIVGRVIAGELLVPGAPLNYADTSNMDGAEQRYGSIHHR